MEIIDACKKSTCYKCDLWNRCKPHLHLKVSRETLIKNDKDVKVVLPKIITGKGVK